MIRLTVLRRQRPEARSSIVLDLNPRMLLQKCND